MAHFAQIENDIVVDVIVADQEFVDSLSGEWIQTSYNTRRGVHYDKNGEPDDGIALRKNYAGIGDTYDRGRDAFIPQQPHASWLLNEETCDWGPPIPQVSLEAEWDEELYQKTGDGWVVAEGELE